MQKSCEIEGVDASDYDCEECLRQSECCMTCPSSMDCEKRCVNKRGKEEREYWSNGKLLEDVQNFILGISENVPVSLEILQDRFPKPDGGEQP